MVNHMRFNIFNKVYVTTSFKIGTIYISLKTTKQNHSILTLNGENPLEEQKIIITKIHVHVHDDSFKCYTIYSLSPYLKRLDDCQKKS